MATGNERYRNFFRDNRRIMSMSLEESRKKRAEGEKIYMSDSISQDTFNEIGPILGTLNSEMNRCFDTSRASQNIANFITYEDSELSTHKDKVRKNAIADKSTIKKNLTTNEIVPSFNVNIYNIGFDGISASDTYNARLVNIESRDFTETNGQVGINLKYLQEGGVMVVSGLQAPPHICVCNLEVDLISNGNVYASYIERGINIAKGEGLSDSIEVQSSH